MKTTNCKSLVILIFMSLALVACGADEKVEEVEKVEKNTPDKIDIQEDVKSGDGKKY